LGCAGNQKDHHHYRQPIFHTSYLYPGRAGKISQRRTQTHTDNLAVEKIPSRFF
jgi:hypothetical protein